MTRDSIDAIAERTLAADLERHYGDEDREYCVNCERPTSNNDRCPDCGRGPYCRACVTNLVQCRRCNMPIDRSEA